MGILDELFRRKPDDEFLPEYAKPELTLQEVLAAAQALTPSVPKSDKPADPLRWAADAIGQNKDLPAPEFFMDPRALSMRNIVHSGLNTAANWLDGTKDPRAVQDQDMIAPLGLGGMGGIVNSMTRPGRDFRIAEAMAREHPGASAVGDIPRFAPIKDASNPTSAAYVADFGSMPTAPRAPMNSNAGGPYAVMADNAKGSAPGTIINSLDMSEAARMQRAREMGFDTDRTWYRGTDREVDELQPRPAGPYADGSSVSATWLTSKPHVAEAWAGPQGRVIDAHVAAPNLEVVERAFRSPDWGAMDPILQRAKEAGKDGVLFKRSQDHPDSIGIDPRVWNASDVMAMFNPSNIRSTQAAFDPAKRDSANLLAASPRSSAPGLAANSTQQPKDASQLSEPMLMELLRRLEEGA